MKRILVVLMLVSSIVFTQTPSSVGSSRSYETTHPSMRDQIEPGAGNWRTWIISSGEDYRLPAPPNPAETQAELRTMQKLISNNDAHVKQQITFWDAGAPAYRWIDLINSRLLAGTATTAFPHRVYTYVALAMYDATIATWESKYHYNRPRPSELDQLFYLRNRALSKDVNH